MSITRSRAANTLLPRYLAHRERDVNDIRELLARGDFHGIGRIGHNLRGNGVSYGFPEMGTLGLQLETAAHTRQETRVRELLLALETWLARVRES